MDFEFAPTTNAAVNIFSVTPLCYVAVRVGIDKTHFFIGPADTH